MSWDVYVTKFEKEYMSPEDIPDNSQPVSLGTRIALRNAISTVFPDTVWDKELTWGTWEGSDGSVEFNLGDDEPVSFMLHVRANESVIPKIIKLIRENKWQAIDCSDNTFLEKATRPEDGLSNWRAYKDDILEKP